MFPEGIEVRDGQALTNRHRNFKWTPVSEFRLSNRPLSTKLEQYLATTENIMLVVEYAVRNSLRLRAVGSNWSFSKVGVAIQGCALNALQLNLKLRISASSVLTNYCRCPEHLLLVQSGNTIRELNEELERLCLSLPTSGANSEQTFVGAISTGTHGSAFNFGAIHESVVGLHIVVGATRHVWLERASYPVVSDAFVQRIGGPEVVRCDEMFNAALVSFGSFGIIHGVMIETEPIFLLTDQYKRLPYNRTLKQAIVSLDLDAVELSDPNMGSIYHFELAINPYRLSEKDRVFARVIYKHPYDSAMRTTTGDDSKTISGRIVRALTDMPGITGEFAECLADLGLSLLYKERTEVGTLGDTFPRSNLTGPGDDAAIGVRLCDAITVLETMTGIIDRGTRFTGVLGIRFVKKSSALFAINHFQPATCVIDIAGLQGEQTRNYFKKVWIALDDKKIPYTMHWGKNNSHPCREWRIRETYGNRVVDAWLRSRSQLLDAEARGVFANDFLESCGLHKDSGTTR